MQVLANTKPTVSVILPVYQVVDYIDECIASILEQSFTDFELIIVDDGSTDGSREKCDVWAEKDERIAVVHQGNAGLSAARNSGIAKAKGEYLLFVDSDDYIRPSLIGVALERLRETQSDICFFKYELLNPNGSLEPYKEALLFPQFTSCNAPQTLVFLFQQQLHNYAWAHIAKASLYVEESNFFPVGRKMEDIATTTRLISRATRACFLDEVLYVYRKREGSIVANWSHVLTFDSVMAFDCIERDVRNQPEEIRIAALNYKVKFLFYCLMMERNLPNSDLDGEAIDLVRSKIGIAAKRCGWGNLSRFNKLKFVLMKMHLDGLVAKMKKE